MESRGLIPAHAGKTVSSPCSGASRGAHPRSRGENALISVMVGTAMGSSPLTRGKPMSGIEIDTTEAAHPRSRGENARRGGPITSGPGSSPLTRGKPVSVAGAAAIGGLIPAHAGKTRITIRLTCARTAHPRSRGENTAHTDGGVDEGGSSPLTRGKHQSRRECRRRMGLIPAHAGKTEHATPRRPAHGAHPRSRGENAELGFQKVGGSGSSPLTRGKQTRWPHAIRGRRLIPAHAGKTAHDAHPHGGGRAHPRSRGENLSGCDEPINQLGSSPLTRGKPDQGCQ